LPRNSFDLKFDGAQRHQLWFIVQTTGGTGIDTEFVVKSLDELNELIFEKINKIDGIVLILILPLGLK